ncbi:hypothetical protein [Enterococcus rivorum]|uniref:hypothetical protein n=1 Tax=Enterococcus rivorum TaxID=762845 RepID=UPI0036369430
MKKNADVVVEHRDKYDNRLLQTKTESKAIGSTYSYTPTNPLTIGSETYVPTSLTPVTGVVQTGGNKVVLYYDLQRTLTVSHVDKITNQLIVDKEKVTKRRGEAYRFTPRTDLKKGNTPYRPLTTDPVTGTIGATNLEITFYYELPYATVGLERLEIDTAKADKGLPFRLQVTQEWLYDPTLLGDEELPVRVTLTDRDTKTVVYEQDYALQDLPTIKGTIPTDFLVKEQRHNYEARIQVGNEEDILVTALQLDTDGYTSSEKELVVAAEEGQVQYKNVVRTARTYGKDMELYYETLNLDVPKLAPQKTGYGFSYTLKPTYTNDLGQTATVGFSLNAPESLLDSFLEYEKKEGKVSVPLEKEGRSYVLPNVWVEKTTGNLFSNAQVETHDPRIKQEVKNGGRKFYVPIWQDLGVYPVEVETTEPIGVHEISVLIEDRLSIEAYMFGTYASSTIQQDEIVLVPIDSKQPFHYQRPNNFTEADLAWFAESK